MYEYRCRITPAPVNGSWPIIDPEIHELLCSPNRNDQCPEGSWCGAPIEYDLPWDSEEINTEYFNWAITGYENIF